MTIDSTIGVVFNYSEYLLESNKFYLYYKTELDVETSLQTIELLTTPENFYKISQIVFSQIYGLPVNLTFTDSSKIISYFINNTEGIKVFNVVATLTDQTQYRLKVKIDAITTTSGVEVPACTPTGFQADFSDFVVTPYRHYLSYEFTTDTGSVILGSTMIDSSTIADYEYDINEIVKYLLSTIQVEDPETFNYLNLYDHFNITTENNILYVEGKSVANSSANYRSSFKIITEAAEEFPEVDIGRYILNQKDVSELEIFSCSIEYL